MTDDEIIINLKRDIANCFDVRGNISFKKIKVDLLDRIVKHTEFLDEYEPKIQERIYCILNDINTVQICPLTNKKLRFSPQTKEYSKSKEYSYANRIIKNPADHKKRNEALLREVQEMYENSDYNLLSMDDCVKIFQLLTPEKNSRINSPIAKNNIDFVCSVFHYTSFMDNLELNISERIYCIQNKITQYPVDSNGLRLKYINIVEGYSRFSSRKASYDYHLQKAKDHISDRFILHEFLKKENNGTTHRINVTCKKCDLNFSPFFINGLWKNIYCPGCEGVVGRSRMEDDVVNYIKSLGISNIETNNRQILNGFELDIYLPDHNLAIELCGILWHSFGKTFPNNVFKEKSDKHKHFKKYNNCKKLNISLLTIFENEWLCKQDIVKSILSNKLGKSDNRIFARKCQFKEVEKANGVTFLEENHIQGKCKYSKSYGLYYNDELVSIMCFGKRKMGRGCSQYELVRFCNKLGSSIIGGASKIIKNANIGDFISYCDLRYSDGDLYRTLGMNLIRTSPPNYFYTLDKINLQNRMNFQKHIIAPHGDSRTEWEIMYDNGYRRIYDCGNLVFKYSKTK